MCATDISLAGPTLTETLDFIRDLVGSEARVDLTLVVHDSSNNSTWRNRYTAEVSNVSADVGKCRITYHEKRITHGRQEFDGDAAAEFDDAVGVVVGTMAVSVTSTDAASGHPTWTTTINPVMWTVTVKYAQDEAVFNFRDEAVADRVATAARHAMQLCGGRH
jgi:hypothetical protein